MLKIPATSATVSVIEQLIHEGININVTMLFSQAVYEQVAQAYLRGLEVLAMQGKEVSTVGSVASFSVSRFDDAICAPRSSEAIAVLITTHLQIAEQERVLPQSFRGNVALAQAKIIYQRYQPFFKAIAGRR